MTTASAIPDEQAADLAYSILVIARKLSQRSEELADVIALSGTEVEVMRTVHLHPGLSATEVAARLGLQRSNVSVSLRVLEEQGLVQKRRSAEDGRALRLVATERAVDNLTRVRLGWADRLRAAGDELLGEAMAAQGVLARVAAALDAPPPAD